MILTLPVLHELLCKLNSIRGTNDRDDTLHGTRLGVIDRNVTGGLAPGMCVVCVCVCEGGRRV